MGKEHTKMFATKGEASAWESSQKLRVRSGEWTDPQRGKVTLEAFAPQWFDSLSVTESTRANYQSVYDTHIKPQWGPMRLDRIAYSDVKKWAANLSSARNGRRLSASRQRQAYRMLRSMLDLAVEDGRLPRNPAKSAAGSTKGLTRRAPRQRSHRYLSHEQLRSLAEAAGDSKTLVLAMGYSGLRWGEAAAVRVEDVDVLRSQIHVRRAHSEVNGKLIVGATKTHATRVVALPKFLRVAIEEQMKGRAVTDLLFPAPKGGPWYYANFRKLAFDPAVKASGLTGLTPHGLRHTAASLAVQAGANVKAVQRMLGHQSAAMTLDVYADLFDGDLQGVAERLDEAARASWSSSKKATVAKLPDAASMPS
ncbi:MAG: site-specific integrase [Nocardioides sp.]|nr:site-specific integrase [Nocardioides sp.]